jgi:uncharacterized protein YdcH (DUF465 family)
MTSQEMRTSLMAADPEFKRLAEEHWQCESKLEEILTSPYLSAEDLIQEATLKKLKLRLKDQMESIIAERRRPFEH